MTQTFAVIIAGGKGERFWPQSRARRPKHLLPIVGEISLLEQTLDRVRALVPPRNTFVITSATQARAVRACCGSIPRENVVVEPVGRDTAPAVALAAFLVEARDPLGVFAVLPADHVIHDGKAYARDLDAAFAAAEREKVLVTIGITPHEPATGFGYINRDGVWKTFKRRRFYRVKRFVEKPLLAVAKRYLASGGYLWNAGMFVWSVSTVIHALERHAPKLYAGLQPVRQILAKGLPLAATLKKVYPGLTRISVDYALLENSNNVVVLPASFDWDDVGAWPAIARHHPQDKRGNVTQGRVLVEQGSNNIVISDSRHLIGVVGIDDVIVVHTADATLVVPKARAQEIKTLLKRLEGEKAEKWL